jgi:small-conductance mechanosensitive channel
MDSLSQIFFEGHSWFLSSPLMKGIIPQFVVILAIFAMSLLVSHFFLWPRLDPKICLCRESGLSRFLYYATRRLSTSLISIFWVWVASGTAQHYGWPREWLIITKILLLAWILSRFIIMAALSMSHIFNRTLSVLLSLVIWLIAILRIAHLFNPALTLLDSIAFTMGGFRLSLLHLLITGLSLAFFLWLNRVVNKSFANWVKAVPNFSPSVQELFLKIFKATFYTLAIIITLSALGLDLTNLAWFSGAVGLGLGFGLQKVISNLASGFIILADKSIKPGDVIQVGETYGWINYLGSRYISVVTRDAIEYLIPNEDFITGRVINWSYSNKLLRLKIPIGIAYGSDIELAMKLMLEAAGEVPRVLPEPEASCRLIGYGDSSIDLQLRVWINDPKNGIIGVKSDVLLAIGKKFQEHGIDIPFPQRVLYHKSIPELRIGNSPSPTRPEKT